MFSGFTAQQSGPRVLTVLGGSGVVISRVISSPIWVISVVTLLITLLIATHEPPSEITGIWTL